MSVHNRHNNAILHHDFKPVRVRKFAVPECHCLRLDRIAENGLLDLFEIHTDHPFDIPLSL